VVLVVDLADREEPAHVRHLVVVDPQTAIE
jgi:hypothetical protein